MTNPKLRDSLKLLVCVSLWLVTGCQSSNVYRANRLPPELMAERSAHINDIDLSRLAQSGGDSEIIYPGDTISVIITTGVEQDPPAGWDLRVNENGGVDVPLVGRVAVAGIRLVDAESLIRDESVRRGKFVNPTVSVVMGARRSNRVTVIGAVEQPGTYSLPVSQSDLLNAIVRAGRLSEDASTVIEIRHPPGVPQVQFASYQAGMMQAPQTIRVDLAVASQQAGGDYRLFDGSTVMVMSKPKRFIHVIGLVNRPDQYEIPDDSEMRLLDAIAVAGGLKLELANKVHIIRNLPTSTEPAVIETTIRAVKQDTSSNIILAAGDVVSVEETPVTFVVGTIRDFVRFGFSAGVPGL